MKKRKTATISLLRQIDLHRIVFLQFFGYNFHIQIHKYNYQ